MASIRFKDIVIFEDEHIIAINKPPFIASLHERFDSHAQSIIELCKAVNEEYSLCHRLDRETSGVMLIAKDNETYRHIAMQFEKRQITKVYHAVVQASVNLSDLEVDLPLYTDSKRKVQISAKKGKPSRTFFNTLKQYKHFSLLACMPETGRLHQIRVHAASQNLPLVCDELYGGKVPELSLIKKKVNYAHDEVSKPLMNRVALHAFSIQFSDLSGQFIKIEAPYPKDFEVLIKLMDKYDELS
ncbi:MAG: RluA family pseudouridine synthase [Bacteroidia bacterium]|nr:RluA family pseudouridine synthase [Bacteroidia bacterium]